MKRGRTEDPSDWIPDRSEEQQKAQRQRMYVNPKRRREYESLSTSMKKMKINQSSSGDESSDDESSDDSSDEEEMRKQLQRTEEITACFKYFLMNAPHFAVVMTNRNRVPTALLIKALLNKINRQANITDEHGKLRTAGNDMLSNCGNLKRLYNKYPQLFI